IDFAARPHVPESAWPVGHAEIAPWYVPAAAYLDAGEPIFAAPLPHLKPTAECRFDRLERWSGRRNLRRAHAAALERDPGLCVCLGPVATGLRIDPASGHVAGIELDMPDGRHAVLSARAVALACGGLETTRLLLVAQAAQPRLFGGPDGALGRYYMGHIEGRIADIVFERAGADREFDFFVDGGGRYVRRRITIAAEAQRRHRLLNLCAWPDNPPLGDPGHGDALLSLAYLSLAMPRLPGFFILNRAHRYSLFFHAEHAPNRDSTVRLAPSRDALGMPRLRIDLRFAEIDARSVVAAHRVIEGGLREAGLGRLDYAVAEPEREAAVLNQATDGYHQIGTARMSADPAAGVVDRDCRVHGTANLFVASSAIFPSSSQANPTLLLAAFSARLAAHLAQRWRELPESAVPCGEPAA